MLLISSLRGAAASSLRFGIPVSLVSGSPVFGETGSPVFGTGLLGDGVSGTDLLSEAPGRDEVEGWMLSRLLGRDMLTSGRPSCVCVCTCVCVC